MNMQIIDRLKELNIATPIAIVGGGATGQSFAKILATAGFSASIFDEKANAKTNVINQENKENVEIDNTKTIEILFLNSSGKESKVDFPLITGEFSSNSLANYQTLFISPGIDLRREVFKNFAGEIISDIELFARLTKRKLIGITGSNGKTTVASLLHSVCKLDYQTRIKSIQNYGQNKDLIDATIDETVVCSINDSKDKTMTLEINSNHHIDSQDNYDVNSNCDYMLCGNVGLPVLSALLATDDNVTGYIIELSSYQLESCPSLHLSISALLNVSEDHLDRYDSYEHYIQAKANILRHSKVAIINLDDTNVVRLAKSHPHTKGFTTQVTLEQQADSFLDNTKTAVYLRKLSINKFLLSQDQIKLVGIHNLENIMAVALMASQLGIDNSIIASACCDFSPIANRYVDLGEIDGIRFINDSKATNVGATAKALAASQQKIVLIAGGLGKGQDFSPLIEVVKKQVRGLVLIGKDAPIIADSLAQIAPVVIIRFADGLASAIQIAISLAENGDAVLLSPACASFDMFTSYVERGRLFELEVEKVRNKSNELVCLKGNLQSDLSINSNGNTKTETELDNVISSKSIGCVRDNKGNHHNKNNGSCDNGGCNG